MSTEFDPFGSDAFKMALSGSHVNFKERERPPLDGQESEIKFENQRSLQDGITILRKQRTRALYEHDPTVRQGILNEAHQFADAMAQMILDQALSEKPYPIDPTYLEVLHQAQAVYAEQDAASGHSIPTQFSVQNLSRATDDMLVRVEEKASSLDAPDHPLSQEEMMYVLHEFLMGTNDLNNEEREKFFGDATKVGGILSGGAVYVELVRKIIGRYADPQLRIDTFVIAVDKDTKNTAFEASEVDQQTQVVIIADDMIDGGSTLLTALWAVGKQFPNATIYSGKGRDQAGGFEMRRKEGHMDYLAGLFQNFADYAHEGRIDEALNVFQEAEKYAGQNDVSLQPGWYLVKKRIDGSSQAED